MPNKTTDLYLILVHDERGTTLVDGHLHRRLGHGRRERSSDVVHRCRDVEGLGKNKPASRREEEVGQFILRRKGPMGDGARGQESGL